MHESRLTVARSCFGPGFEVSGNNCGTGISRGLRIKFINAQRQQTHAEGGRGKGRRAGSGRAGGGGGMMGGGGRGGGVMGEWVDG